MTNGPDVRETAPTDPLSIAASLAAIDPVLVLSVDGTVLRANAAAQEVFGPEIVGSAFGIPTSPGQATEIELLTSSGPRVAELRTGTGVLDGATIHVVGLRDVTERRRVEQSLRDFVATASHEFRTPLFAIAGFGEALTAQWDELTDEDRRRYVAIMHRQAVRLTRLTDDLLTVARLDAEGLETTPQATLVAVVLDRVRPLVEVDFDARVPQGMSAMVDPEQLEDVLVNLLTNAAKYGEPPIELIGCDVGERAEVRVVDHGQGVPSEFRARLFDRFSRDRRAARNQPGTGLGLSIAKGLIERNGGTLEYESTAGGGATFVLRLPRP